MTLLNAFNQASPGSLSRLEIARFGGSFKSSSILTNQPGCGLTCFPILFQFLDGVDNFCNSATKFD